MRPRLSETCQANRVQLFLRFMAKLRDRVVVEGVWNRLSLESLKALDLGCSPIDVAGVLGFEHDLLDDIGREHAKRVAPRLDVAPMDFRATQPGGQGFSFVSVS